MTYREGCMLAAYWSVDQIYIKLQATFFYDLTSKMEKICIYETDSYFFFLQSNFEKKILYLGNRPT